MREWIIKGAREAALDVAEQDVYGATQGPRLETAAEIRRMAQDGCTVVGMTGMPEAALARELDLAYACCAVVVNPAAGIDDKPVDMNKLSDSVEMGMNNARSMIKHALRMV